MVVTRRFAGREHIEPLRHSSAGSIRFRTRARRLLALGFLLAGAVPAQISGGVFQGEVRDASNAVVPQTKILIRSGDNGMQVIAESNGRGLYVSPNLIPGSYLLSVTRTGFRSEVFGPVLLDVNQTVRVDFALKTGNVTESIRVDAAPAQLLSSESAEVSQVIGSKQVAEIPLNGRTWQQLIDLSAGVNPGAPGESGSPNPVNVDGQRTKGNLFMVDGISVTSSAEGRGNDFNIPLEAVQEFSIQAGAYSAEFGDVAGGVINLQSKSGTNNWHGSLFEFFRNNAMDAANFFSNATGQPKNPLQYNQFGGSVGGPIRRDKTFFFADYQGTITHSSSPMVTRVPLTLTNLIFNAVDAMQGGGTLTLRTKSTGEAVPTSIPRRVHVQVEDTGVGMDEETRRRCLEPFFTTKGERGTGLGLGMVYGVAQRLNAELEVESAPGRGTTVGLNFPAAPTGAQPSPIAYPPGALARLQILIVDDDPLIIRSLRAILEDDGHAVTAATGGQEGIDILRAAAERDERFAVVITDLGMPYIDGRKVASAVKMACRDTPVILLTGWGQRLVAEEDVPANVDCVLNKPPKLYQLRAALSELVPGSRNQVLSSAGNI